LRPRIPFEQFPDSFVNYADGQDAVADRARRAHVMEFAMNAIAKPGA
jgi:hypothetical protein